MAIRPDLLQSGDKVAIVAPAGKVVAHSHEKAVSIFQDWGLQQKISQYALGGGNYFSGTDEQRLTDFQAAINSPEIKAIFCARGGYGTTRIIDKIDLSPLLTEPKWIVGFSDITTVHFKLHNLGIESIHSIMPTGFGNADQQSISSLKQILFNQGFEYKLPGNPLNKAGEASAPIIGGNLSMIADSLSTSSEIDTSGKILFIEEIDEYLYKIDRMMVQLLRAGKLNNLAGLIVGHMTSMKDTKVPFGKTVNEIVQEITSSFSYPTAYNIPIGHERLNLAVPCTREITLSVSSSGVELKGN